MEICKVSEHNSEAIQILLASTPTIFRMGLRNLLQKEPDLRVVSEASEAMDIPRLVDETKPDIVLLDLSLRGLAALKPRGHLKAIFDSTRTLVLSATTENNDAAEALREGAGGFVFKNSSADLLIRGIRNLMNGGYWVGGEAMSDRFSALNRAAEFLVRQKSFGLTRRELEVISQIVSGYSNKEVAVRLSISDDTVKHHLTNIFDKLGVYNRLELALFAIHHGLVGRSLNNGRLAGNEG
jgi:two-component system, NarL family, nitrate/nitrite response regulator NarL